LAPEHEVIGLDIKDGPYTTVIGSITDGPLVDDLCTRVEAVIHTAALHAPHVGLVPDDDFRHTNVCGTEALLRASLKGSVQRFVYTSTTSLYGQAMVPRDRAVWVTEALEPIPRDIYDETKIAAEAACARAAQAGLTCVSLRMSRCFPEPDRLMAIYRLYRGVDPRDVSQAYVLALTARLTGFKVFNISAATPFQPEDAGALLTDAGRVILKYYPWAKEAFARRDWPLPETIDRVYAIDQAQQGLGYRPQYNFASLFEAKILEPWFVSQTQGLNPNVSCCYQASIQLKERSDESNFKLSRRSAHPAL
jgi:UDP-glucose 4-epimerase